MTKRNRRKIRKNRKVPNGTSENNYQKNISSIKAVSTNVKSDSNVKKVQPSQPNARKKTRVEDKNKSNYKKNIIPRGDLYKKDDQRNKKNHSLFSKKKTEDKNKRMRSRRRRPSIYKKNNPKSTICPVCNRMINNMLTAIEEKNTRQPAHFDCIISQIKKTRQITGQQRLIYIGQGNFAVIEDVREKGKQKFKIIEQYEYLTQTAAD